ncbi:S9 family peptidase [Streptomyces thermocarboxydus]
MTASRNPGSALYAPESAPGRHRGAVRPAAPAVHGCWYPSADPSGRHVAFICDRAGVPQLWTGPVDGPEAHRLDADPHPVTEVAWSPDGRWIAYTTAPGGGELTRVLCVRPDGTGQAPAGRRRVRHLRAARLLAARRLRDRGDRHRVRPARPRRPVPRGGVRTARHRTRPAVGGPRRPGRPARPGRRTARGGRRRRTAGLRPGAGGADPVRLSRRPGGHRRARPAVQRTRRRQPAGVRPQPRRPPRPRLPGPARTPRGPGRAHRGLRRDLRLPGRRRRPWIGGFSPSAGTVWLRSDAGREYAALLAAHLDPRGELRTTRVVAEREDCGLELLALGHDGRRAVLAWNRHGVSDLELLVLRSAPPHGTGTGAAPRPRPATRAASTCPTRSSPGSRPPPTPTPPSSRCPDRVATPACGGCRTARPCAPLVLPRRGRLPAGFHPGAPHARAAGRPGRPPARRLVLPRPRPLARRTRALRPPSARRPRGTGTPRPRPLYLELLNRGLDVFAPDVRGSSGHGRSFTDADLGAGRFSAINDVADCAAHVMVEGLADPGGWL